MYTELPLIETSTPAERLAALKDAKELMSGAKPGGFGALFADGPAGPGSSTTAIDGFIRLAEYITTGHDYKDTHPEGKRRPIIRNTHVTVMAPPSFGPDDLEHFMHHVKNGDVADFFEDLLKDAAEKPETADDEKSAEGGPDA
jgi:hypothetical protein